MSNDFEPALKYILAQPVNKIINVAMLAKRIYVFIIGFVVIVIIFFAGLQN
jgi:hypothetical protein